MPLIERVRRTLRHHGLATSSTRIVVALSGGPDSMALLQVLRDLHGRAELTLVAAAHLNHQLRSAAGTDEQFCASVAAGLQLPFTASRADVRAMAAVGHRSIEDAAHLARHAFFERVLAEHDADVVAVGHTRDDQAETFLLRLLRGAGSRGLAGMHPRSGHVIRPLLDCSRAEVRAFLHERDVPFVHDESNDDVGIPRNRVRAELLPLLQARFNPRIVEVLATEAELARLDEQALRALAEDWCATHAAPDADARTWRLAVQALTAAPTAVAWRSLHIVMTQAGGGRLIGFGDVGRAWALAEEGGGGFDAPGQRVQREGEFLVLMARPAAGPGGRRRPTPGGQATPFSRVLPVPGEVAIPEIGALMTAEVGFSAESAPRPDRYTALVPKERAARGLAIRNRRPGDRLKPSAAGHRKLQDVLVDRKVPIAERDRVPIVTDPDGRIVWVVGHAFDWDFRVSDPSEAVVVLKFKGVGGSF